MAHWLSFGLLEDSGTQDQLFTLYLETGDILGLLLPYGYGALCSDIDTFKEEGGPPVKVEDLERTFLL